MKRVIMVNRLEDVVKGVNFNLDQIYAIFNQQRRANKWLRFYVVSSAIAIIALLRDNSVLVKRTNMLKDDIEELNEKLNEIEGASKCD